MGIKRFNLSADEERTPATLGYSSDAEFELDMQKCESLITHAKASSSKVLDADKDMKQIVFNSAQFSDMLLEACEKDENLLPLIMLRFARLLAQSESDYSRPMRNGEYNGMTKAALFDKLKKELLSKMIEEGGVEALKEHDCDTCDKGSVVGNGECPIEPHIREAKAELAKAEAVSGKYAIDESLRRIAEDHKDIPPQG